MGMFDFGISATASHVNKLLDIHAQNKQQAREYDRQKEFAQNGIRWRVEDAKAAGIHPLAALGAHTMSYSPQAVTGADYGIGDLGQAFGQNIDRAVNAKTTQMERDQHDLDMDYRRAQIKLVEAQTNQIYADTAEQALNSIRNVSKQQLPPPMPTSGGTRRNSAATSANLDPTIPEFGMTRDPDGVIRHVVPSDAMAQRTEDKFIIEWLPWIRGYLADIGAKYFGQPIDGYYWHGSDKGYRKGKPAPKPLFKSHPGSMVYDYRGR